MKHAFSIDYEDWYQGLALGADTWNGFEKRLRIGHDKLLNLLDRSTTKATFFLVGQTILDHPDLVREIISAGHEIGCHTMRHGALYDMNADSLAADLDECEQALEPFGIKYTGFRAPYFSIDARSWWALPLLKERGFQYDSSIYPANTFRTGMPGFKEEAHLLEDEGLVEFPMTKFPMLQFSPGTGGAYFRILPYRFFRQKLRALEAAGKAINFYIHPWELDADHPKLSGLSARIRLPHYYNLHKTERRIERLLSDFQFGTVREVLVEKGLLS